MVPVRLSSMPSELLPSGVARRTLMAVGPEPPVGHAHAQVDHGTRARAPPGCPLMAGLAEIQRSEEDRAERVTMRLPCPNHHLRR